MSIFYSLQGRLSHIANYFSHTQWITCFSFLFQGYLSYIVDSPELELSAEDVNALFGNIEDIHEFNK